MERLLGEELGQEREPSLKARHRCSIRLPSFWMQTLPTVAASLIKTHYIFIFSQQQPHPQDFFLHPVVRAPMRHQKQSAITDSDHWRLLAENHFKKYTQTSTKCNFSILMNGWIKTAYPEIISSLINKCCSFFPQIQKNLLFIIIFLHFYFCEFTVPKQQESWITTLYRDTMKGKLQKTSDTWQTTLLVLIDPKLIPVPHTVSVILQVPPLHIYLQVLFICDESSCLYHRFRQWAQETCLSLGECCLSFLGY